MKKIFVGLLTLLSVFVLVGCSKSLKLEFSTDGGSAIDAYVGKKGDLVEAPTSPTKDGLTFDAWYLDIDLTEKAEFPITLTQNSIVYAKWVVTLTFDTQGGQLIDPIVAEGGTPFVMPNDPVREGYVFVGWYTNKNYDENNRLSYVMPRTNTTAYARWQIREEGSVINLVPSFVNNDDGAYIITKVEDGVKLTATSGKGEWAYAAQVMDVITKENTTIVVELMGTKDCNVTLKVEGGDAVSPSETTVQMTGAMQTVIWSCTTDNMSSVIGQKFLVFLNGGTVGAGETPEYVIIKSIKLYRTVEANDEQKSAIYFATNGAEEIATIYQKAGTTVTRPADPVKDGYQFMGWFTDKKFENAYEFSTMPVTSVILYAKWEKLGILKADIDLIGREINVNGPDPAVYTVNSSATSYVIKKNATGNEWDCVLLPMTGLDMSGYNVLRLEIKGTKGEQVLVKVNDQKEFWLTFNGEVQYFDLPFDLQLNPEKSLVIFANAGKAGESGEITITKLAYGNYLNVVNMPNNWAEKDENSYVIEQTNGVVTIKKTLASEWACALLDYSTVSVPEEATMIRIVVKGEAGKKIMFKVNDSKDNKEFMIECTGEVQVIEKELGCIVDNTLPLVVFCQPGMTDVDDVFEIYEVSYLCTYEETLVKKNVNLMNLLPVANGEDPSVYTVTNENNKITIKKNANGEAWSCVLLSMEGIDIADVNVLRVALKGKDGDKVLFKVNDQKEFWVTCNGEVQYFEFSFDITLSEDKKLVIFANAGVDGESGVVEITKLAYSNYKTMTTVPTTWVENDADTHTITEEAGVVTIKKNAASEWIYVKNDISALEIDDTFNTLKLVIKGEAGKQILVKVNDSKEKWIDCDGSLQTVYFELPVAIDKTIPLLLFAEGGKAGTGAAFEIHEVLLLAGMQELNLLDTAWEASDAGFYTINSTAEALKITKNDATEAAHWSHVKVTLENADFTWARQFVVTVKGTEGEEIMFKVNDTKEFKVVCTGTVQELTFDLGYEFNLEKPTMIIFANPGAVGSTHEFEITKISLTK